MLISFSLSNYKSFKDKATLEMSPGRSQSKKNHVVNDCLKTAAIFGGNASGKSNFIKGLKTMKKIVTDPYYTTKDPIHNWNSVSEETETSFEVVFSVGKKQYTYGLSVEPVGKKSESISKQSFFYKVVKEHLSYAEMKDSIPEGTLQEIKIIDVDNSSSDVDNSSSDVDKIVWKDLLLKYQLSKENLVDNIKKLDKMNSYKIESEKIKTYYTETIENEDLEFIYNTSPPSNNSIDKTSEFKIFIKTGNPDELIYAPFEYIEDKSIYKKIRAQSAKIKIKENDVESKRIELENAQKERDKYSSLLNTRDHNNSKNRARVEKSEFDKCIQEVLGWFHSSLIILETDDFHLPMDKPSLLTDLSEIVDSMDVGIDRLEWVDFNTDLNKFAISKIKGEMSEKNNKKLERCREFSIDNSAYTSVIIKSRSGFYLFNYWMGDESVQCLSAHHSSGKRVSKDLSIESDGTVRIIELSSILIPSNKEITFVVDELDRRLHPLLTLNFISLFMNNENSKQLIFTTHETRLMTTDIFRKDEIWFVDRKGGYSSIESLDRVNVKQDKRLDKMYLNNELSGTPKVQPFEFDLKCD